MFASLHNHTYSSNIRFLDSINKPEDMVNKAISLGFSGIAFTDHESLSAAISIMKIKDKIKAEHPDFKIIFGNEIYLIDPSDVHNSDPNKRVQYYHFILLAKDEIGWQQLKTLSSRAWERGYVERGVMRTPTTYTDLEEVIGQNKGHIFGFTACLGGELATKILQHDVSGANNFTKWCISVFGKDNFAFELQPSDSEEQKTVNQILIKFSQYYGVPYVLTTDSHYLNKEDFNIHSAFLNSKKSGDRETEKFYRFTYIMSEDEMRDICTQQGLTEDQINTAFKNTVDICNQFIDYDFRHSTIVPKIKVPEFSLNYDLYHKGQPAIDKFYDSPVDQDKYLMYQIEQGLKNKNVTIDTNKLERINYELDILDFISVKLNQNLSAYLNLTAEIVNIAWKVSLVGCGRGSACGFYINYLLGITQADPLVYNLPAWRFLNKERAELPDVDEDFQPEKTGDIVALLREVYGQDNVLNCATFKTESLKSAILTCGRGLGFNNDEMQALAALVPAHRGITYNLEQCINGDEEKGLDPVPGFLNKFENYPGLLEAVRKIEGMPTNASIHASALYIFNNGYLDHNSLMRAPNKTPMTAFNMHDSDDQGALKMDVLRTDAQSKMAKCLDLLIKDKQIEWQGSLRKTYDKYLHPDVLDYTNPDMWKKAAAGQITNLFQFETQVGSVCIQKAKPENVMQLAEINSIMRLQVEDGEQPIDRYVRFRNDPDLWDLEMLEEGLNRDEMEVLHKYLDGSHGVSGSQEVLMRILMDDKVCGFTLGEANAARKAIAKKQQKQLIQLKKDFFDKGLVRSKQVFLDYVWKYCISPQLGYSFSLNHTLPYSVIAVQEMNLATRWNPLYWQCACLCINAGNSDTDFDTDEEEDDFIEETPENAQEDEKTAKRAAPNYGKIAKAIADAQFAGVKIELPDINTSQADFVPDIENNSILYSLSAITAVSQDLYDRIIANRPFSSVNDFIERIQPTQAQMVGLIKAGCFDKLEKQSRQVLMLRYFQQEAEKEYPLKDKLTSVHLKKALELGLNLTGYEFEIKLFKFKKYIDSNCKDTDNKRYVLSDESCIKFFRTYLENKLKIDKNEYGYLPGSSIWVKMSALKRVYDEAMESLMIHLNTEEGRTAFMHLQQEDYVKDLKDKFYDNGNLSAWEMDTMCFYREKHELSNINNLKYNIHNFNELPEYPEVGEDGKIKAKTCAIAGTVTNYNNSRHTISLLTTYGVVDVKIYSGVYTEYSQKISKMDPTTKQKVTIDEGWFKRGTKLIVYGFRRENMFNARKDYSDKFPKIIGLIEDVRMDGDLKIRYNRNKKLVD